MSIYDDHKPAAGDGGLYLKIKDGETVKLRIASEPAIFENVGEREGEKTITTRYGWVVYNQDSKQAQILQQGPRFFKSIAGLAQDEEWGDPTNYDIKIKREGSSFNDTTYTVTPSANREPLDKEAQEAVRAIDLLGKLEASPFSQHVYWLADVEKGSGVAANDVGKAVEVEKTVAAPSKPVEPDVVIEDIGDEPIDLNDVPF